MPSLDSGPIQMSPKVLNEPAAMGRPSGYPRPYRRQSTSGRAVPTFLYVGLIGLAMLFGSKLGEFGATEAAFVFIVAGVSAMLAVQDSRHLIPWILTIWVTAPFFRRIVDWLRDEYTSVTIISLLPMLATLAVLIPTLPRLAKIKGRLRLGLVMVFGSVLYATALGVFNFGTSAVFEASGWVMPVLVFAYLATRESSALERRYWLSSLVVIAALAAVYGWTQFLTAPPWDMLWLVESGMTSSMGRPEPLKFRVFSTLNATGVAGVLWAMALPIALIVKPVRGPAGIVLAALIASALGITMVRIAWMMAVVGCATLVYLLPGTQKWRTLVILLVGGGGAIAAMPFLPGGQAVVDRAMTFSDVKSDNSFQARASLIPATLNQLSLRPLGVGIGGVTRGKLAGTNRATVGMDNGYADLLIRLGLVGMVACTLGFLLIVSHISSRHMRTESCIQTRAIWLSTLAMVLTVNLAANSFAGLCGVLFWMMAGVQASSARVFAAKRF